MWCRGFITVVLLTFSTLGVTAVRADFVDYHVSVDSSGVNGQNGNLDFQFNPGASTALGATITLTNFQTVGGVLSQPATLTGDAIGSLPGSLTLDNGSVYNDVFQGFTYGASFNFLLTLSGPAIDSPGGTFGSSFALSLYDATGSVPLLTIDPNGSVLTVNLNPDGTTTVQTFAQSSTNYTPVATATLVNTVPEPSSLILLITALPVAYVWRTLKGGCAQDRT